MCVCVCVCDVCMCVHAQTLRCIYYKYIYIYTHMHIYVYMYIYAYIHTERQVRTQTHTHTHTHTHIYIYIYICVCVCVSVCVKIIAGNMIFSFPSPWIYDRGLRSSYDDTIFAVDEFLTMGFNHSNIDGKIMLTAKGIMLKNKPNLVTFHENILVRLGIFQPTFIFHFRN